MKEIYDAIVVGAGPAGATATYFLGEAGKRVVVLEKESLPRYKTWGGGLSIRFLQEQFPFSFDAIVETQAKALAAAIEVEAPVSPDIMRRFADRPVFIFGEIKLGYLWIFPKSDHLSVGIAALHPKRGTLQATLRQVMSRYGISLEGVRLHGHPIPIYTHREPVATHRALLVGDAAGLVDPLSGQGIRYAIKSGRLSMDWLKAWLPRQVAWVVTSTVNDSVLWSTGI